MLLFIKEIGDTVGFEVQNNNEDEQVQGDEVPVDKVSSRGVLNNDSTSVTEELPRTEPKVQQK